MRGSSCVRFSLKCVATFRIWTKIAGTSQADDLDSVMDTDRSVQWTNKQLTRRPAFCKISTGSDISPCTRDVQEIYSVDLH
jgi:hypothetical protein